MLIKKKFVDRTNDAANNPNTVTRLGPGNVNLPNIDEELMVWMRTAGLPTFKKLHRIISDITLNDGDQLWFTINNTYPVQSFSGQKALVLSTTSWMGGKNDFLGLAYLVVGAICMALSLIFFIKQKKCPRQLGETSSKFSSTTNTSDNLHSSSPK